MNQVIVDTTVHVWYYYVTTLFDVNVSSDIELPYLKVNVIIRISCWISQFFICDVIVKCFEWHLTYDIHFKVQCIFDIFEPDSLFFQIFLTFLKILPPQFFLLTSAIYWLNGKPTQIMDIDHLKTNLSKNNFQEVLRFKSVRSFKNHLLKNWRLVI